ncbi:hypothetical protein [Paenibacillus lemnae]|uniref:hypothetical protein n=1 Tax=Paenibacillus lemnae TaxID=1330551 RepID=UPI00146A6726|nr:hypothetical protein [Paenibacillus lemnae]
MGCWIGRPGFSMYRPAEYDKTRCEVWVCWYLIGRVVCGIWYLPIAETDYGIQLFVIGSV